MKFNCDSGLLYKFNMLILISTKFFSNSIIRSYRGNANVCRLYTCTFVPVAACTGGVSPFGVQEGGDLHEDNTGTTYFDFEYPLTTN